eukprot:TRINITY_DN8275_c0_g1_i1.p1 TRINITY_DN8275_c0_g1~~TRINITY_DN8275_c0_g1_i1.p1  ORF type:complete len:198 (+),score=50.67 TRINITY_DN8275_c0_g1_i1:57-650(+)
MKFHICGDLDAPDWILKEIEILSKISVVKFRSLCLEVLNKLTGGDFDYDRVASQLAGSDVSDIKAIVAAVTYMIKNSAKYNVKPEVVSQELQQLGLPSGHAGTIEKILLKDKDRLRDYFKSQILKLNRLDSVDWRVDFILASSNLQELNTPSLQLNLNVRPSSDPENTESHNFGVDQDKLRVLLHELKVARALMDTI